jgi:5-oxoprolinase (ATP-hydrolysing)
MSHGWQFWIDRGGTFTDIVARRPDGRLETCKLLSDNPGHYADAALHGMRTLMQRSSGPAAIEAIKMGTTVGTNALLERRGEPTALVITAGFADALRIGQQSRPDIFALDIRLPEMLYARVIEAQERISAHGEVVRALDEQALRVELEHARAAGLDSLAIVLLHGYRFSAHEVRCAEIAADIGFRQISVSHEVSPLPKLVSRGDTTLVDAYLSPVLRRYVARMRTGLDYEGSATPLYFMQSHGRLAEAAHFRGRDCILSGPAGGVVGMVASARVAGIERLIGFDMGGTSTDVSLYDGQFERTEAAVIDGIRIGTPMLRIHTVAAGGGSTLRFAAGRLQVGPQSAGAMPGPVCYRRGGPLTVTDANLLLGRIQADYFPCTFGPDADQPLDSAAVRAAFTDLCAEVNAQSGQSFDAEKLALGFVTIAVDRMAHAIKQISVRRGHDPADFTLACFGGAAGQHACQVADALGIKSIWLHPLAGVLSAYGMGHAGLGTVRLRGIERPLDAAAAAHIEQHFAQLEREARTELRAAAASIQIARRAVIKIHATEAALKLPWPAHGQWSQLRADFHAAYRTQYGFAAAPEAELRVAAIELEAVIAAAGTDEPPCSGAQGPPAADSVRRVHFAGGPQDCPVFRRETLSAGAEIAGPAIIAEAHATTVLEPGWAAHINAWGHLLLVRRAPQRGRDIRQLSRDPVRLELFGNLFMHIAEEMGIVLEQTARSVNIKERLDFSCAIFDGAGELIANAPHIPVHLGSMGDTVHAVLQSHGHTMRPGDAYVSNAPYEGGTHLPDITVMTPVWTQQAAKPAFVVACRAHHADIGGISPGSMPAGSRSIDEEGIVLANLRLVSAGRMDLDRLREQLGATPYPARNPDQNIADLQAQLAANQKGVAELLRVVERHSLPVVQAYMAYLKDNAEECVRAAIAGLKDGAFVVTLDGGERIAVQIRIDPRRRHATLDFGGTSPMSRGNFNAPAAITRAAVLYVFRTLVDEPIPLNAGCFRPLTIELPSASLLDPRPPAAVVAGNVETSQCIVDALLAALGACAAAQGTMNNLSFGDAEHQYYETIGGGAGAGPGFDGADGVQTHMTNSRLTDAEILELQFPVRLRRFSLRRGSGGAGRFHGGDGLIRDIEFLAPLRVSLLTNRRRHAPFGLAGGQSGQPGRNTLIRADGQIEALASTAECTVGIGDRLVIETPGGGGFGTPD